MEIFFIEKYYKSVLLTDSLTPKWFRSIKRVFILLNIINLSFYIFYNINNSLLHALSYYNALLYILWIIAWFIMGVYFQSKVVKDIVINEGSYDSNTLCHKIIRYGYDNSRFNSQIASFVMLIAVIMSLYLVYVY